METSLRNNYFVFVKAVGIIALAFNGTTSFLDDTSKAGLMFLISAVYLLFAIASELDNGRRRRIILCICEGAAAAAAICLSPSVGIWFAAIFYLDIVGRHGLVFYAGVFLLMIASYSLGIDIGLSFMILALLVLIYYQHYKVISWYRKSARENLMEETRLKSDMEHSNIAHRDELNRSRLKHENELLEEKGRISQALHDKLGHSINGSLYKLEAAKVLMDKDTKKSGQILQEVIDSLRGSMDEIRVIIRNERPDKKRMALKSLQALLNECEEQYGIKTSLEMSPDDDRQIPENIWEIILDNSFEAVTNALKYSGCTEIGISIITLGEVVRATVKDNGKGALDGYEEGMGIQGMKDRVRKVKGYIDIDAAGGFTINMVLPIKTGLREEKDGSDQGTDR